MGDSLAALINMFEGQVRVKSEVVSECNQAAAGNTGRGGSWLRGTLGADGRG